MELFACGSVLLNLRQASIEETPGILRKGSHCPLPNRLIYGFQSIKIYTWSNHV